MKQKFELLAPGGDLLSIKAAIAAGADAIYCGLDKFNARNRATNISLSDLETILPLAHKHQCKIFLTLNIMILQNEIATLIRLIEKLVKINLDGIIVQDLGLAYIIKKFYPMLELHASTQLNTHNKGQIDFLKKLGFKRINLARELNYTEITELTKYANEQNISIEIFVHGSYCIGFSGLCYISSVKNGASGNRGRCSQPCRSCFIPTRQQVSHPLNLKDNCAYLEIEKIAATKAYSLKIEGRIKKPHYVYQVVKTWREQLDSFCEKNKVLTNITDLEIVFNRNFHTGFLNNNLNKDMFIDNPRDNSAYHLAKTNKIELSDAKNKIYALRTNIIDTVNAQIKKLDNEIIDLPIEKKKNIKLPNIDHLKRDIRNVSEKKAQLSILIDSEKQFIELKNKLEPEIFKACEIFLQIPSAINDNFTKLETLLRSNPKLIPFFPAILFKDDFKAAIALIDKLHPALIVTNNSGIGFYAGSNQIKWVAGPEMNIANSHALLCLQTEYNAAGAFISNEIDKIQIQRILPPNNFKLYASIYYPITLLTSRQCLFQQTSGCKKDSIQADCLTTCKKQTKIENQNKDTFFVYKNKGMHNQLINEKNCLNLEIINQLPNLFSNFFIDLRKIRTKTKINIDLNSLLVNFNKAICNDLAAQQYLQSSIRNTTNQQYKKGLG